MTSKTDTDKAVRSVIQTWKGGERKLAGARASELVYGSGNKPNDKLLDQIAEDCPGIREYITAPRDRPIETVPDHGGNPNVEDQQNTASATKSNTSSERAKDEQKVIDDALAPGREQRETAGELGSTKLNPAGSDQDPKGAAANPRNAKTSK
jgi:hypothetical protein